MANELITLADSLEAVFDEAVVNGDDNELFASGYLRGHFDLVVAQLELRGEESPALLWEELRAALKQTKDELNPQDQQHVQNMLERLIAAS
ncbi:YfcL protein [Idiomarina sp. A28L]|uniref:YfcL family protein n=1 Tax=Idiomarina sp. A28L TaxID=1036674 RepID=UPI0002138E66|nr:YfcL family protein [Idiomarina sp. A28L]EGN76301.1 YfcL protein [Idiomarina sp. A28L]